MKVKRDSPAYAAMTAGLNEAVDLHGLDVLNARLEEGLAIARSPRLLLWDLFRSHVRWANELFGDLDDAHIETALKAVCRDLGIILGEHARWRDA